MSFNQGEFIRFYEWFIFMIGFLILKPLPIVKYTIESFGKYHQS